MPIAPAPAPMNTAPSVSPFHEGEQAVQARAGVREKLEAVGRTAIRDFMPDQHRAFFEQLPFVIAATADPQGQPWASVLANPPGFIRSPDARELVIKAQPLPGSPLAGTLTPGAAIGLLGIEPHTRRRNRMNGVVKCLSEDGFSVSVHQSFGNCPKYIQARKPQYMRPQGLSQGGILRSDRLDDTAHQLIRRADCFFIATTSPAAVSTRHSFHGADVSHRGGKPGFVRVDNDRTLTSPEFVGNFFFNTLGNLVLNPVAGLLFIDFSAGDLLYVAATVEIIWDGPEVDRFLGAQRLLRFGIQETIHAPASLPLHWGEAQLSPLLERTGEWLT
jgi:predicted pyridoxine 5'-phosphate oxidase superfamily flavin-nucleotide-binding protein